MRAVKTVSTKSNWDPGGHLMEIGMAPKVYNRISTCSFGSGTSHSGFTRFNPVELGRGAVEPLNRG